MTPEAQIYDFENVIPKAVADALFAAGLTALHPLSDAEYQRQRPRVEVTFKLGGAITPLRIAPSTIPEGFPPQAGRNCAWSGELEVHAITDVAPPGKLTHAEYRATVRNACATLLLRVNDGTILPYHCLNALIETGTTHGIRTQDGYEQSTITFHVEFSINIGAWDILTVKPQFIDLVPAGAVFDLVRNNYILTTLVSGNTYTWVRGSNEAPLAINGLAAITNDGPPGAQVSFTASYTGMIFDGPAGQSVDLELRYTPQ